MAFTIPPSFSSKHNYSIWQTLSKALKLLQKSLPLFIPLLLFSTLIFSILFLFNYLSISPIASDLFTKLIPLLRPHPSPLPPAEDLLQLLSSIITDTQRLATTQLPFSLAAFPLSILFLIATIHTFSSAYNGGPLTLLSLFQKIKTRWYQTFITQFYIILLTVGFSVLSSVLVGLVKLTWGDLPVARISVTLLLTVGGSVFVFLHTRWRLGQVITVVEKKDTYGIGALSWAVELFIGNVCRGVMITILDIVVGAAIDAAYLSEMSSVDLDLGKQIRISTVMVAAYVLWNMFSIAVYTVFYYECRESFGLGLMVGGEEDLCLDKYVWMDDQNKVVIVGHQLV